MASDIDSLISIDLRSRLSAYLAGREALDDFYDWFHAEVGFQISDQPAELCPFAYQVWRLLSEYDAGGWTEQELKVHLKALAEGTISPASSSAEAAA